MGRATGHTTGLAVATARGQRFDELFGSSRGRRERDTVASQTPSAAARAALVELTGSGHIVRPETLGELYRYRGADRLARPLLGELQAQVLSALVRSGYAQLTRDAKLTLQVLGLRDEVSRVVYREPGAAPPDGSHSVRWRLHLWPGGAVEPLPCRGRDVTFACGHTHHAGWADREERMIIPSYFKQQPHLFCRACLTATPHHHLRESASTLWPTGESARFAALAAEHANVRLEQFFDTSKRIPNPAEVSDLAAGSWQSAFVERTAAWARQEAARLFVEFGYTVPADLLSTQDWRRLIDSTFRQARTRSHPTAAVDAGLLDDDLRARLAELVRRR